MESKTELQELSAKFFFSCPSFQHTGLFVTSTAGVFFMFSFHCGSFHQVGPLMCLASPSWGPSQDCFSWVKTKK